MKSSIPSHGIAASKSQFHAGTDFSKGIDYVKSMPGVLQKIKIRALSYRYHSKRLTYKKSGLTVAALYRKCIWRRVRGGVEGQGDEEIQR
jgi:hypothetical protein